MKQLKYVGKHQPKNMIVEVDDTEVVGLLATGEYEELGKKSSQKIKKKVEKVLDKVFEEEEAEDDNSK